MRRQQVQLRMSSAERLGLHGHIARANSQLLRYSQAIRLFLLEFGLSPASRSRVRLSPAGAGLRPDEPDEMSQFDTPPALHLVPQRPLSPPCTEVGVRLGSSLSE
jgi:hypothetical protein